MDWGLESGLGIGIEIEYRRLLQYYRQELDFDCLEREDERKI